MTTPSGQIGLSDVNVELGFPSTTSINMNQSNVRTLAGVGGSGTIISMNDLRGKSNRVAIALTISSPVANYDVYSNRGPTYDPGKSDITLTIQGPAVVYSSSTGSSALVVPSAFNPADTVTIVNQGVILGKGGNGGRGAGNYQGDAQSGSSGGPALSVSRPVTINNANRIAGGGGGGGGGGRMFGIIGPPGDDTIPVSTAGSGGGGGIGNGSGGAGGVAQGEAFLVNGNAGQSGTLTANGSGGPANPSPPPYVVRSYGGAGGAGGTYGSSGSTGGRAIPNESPPWNYGAGGGASGAAVSGNPYITWPNTGTRNGPIS